MTPAVEKGSSSILSMAYFALAVLQAGMGVAMLMIPQAITERLLNMTLLPTSLVFFSLAAATAFPMSSALLALQGGASKDALDKPTYRRLNLAILTSAALLAIQQVMHQDINNLWNAGICYGVSALVTALCGFSWVTHLKGEGGLVSIVRGWASGIPNLFQVPNRQSLVYSIFTVIIAGMVGMQFVASEAAKSLLFTDAYLPGINLYLKHVTAVGLFFATVACYCLKTAADVDVLHQPAFIKLNFGLGVMGAVQFMVLLSAVMNDVATASPYLRWMLVAQAAFSGFTLTNAISAKKEA